MDYIYTHCKTLDTTGYFSCEPAHSIELAQAFKLLDQRSNDTFLRSHILRKLTNLNKSAWTDFAKYCIQNKLSSAASLLIEFSHFQTNCRNILGSLWNILNEIAQSSSSITQIANFSARTGKDTLNKKDLRNFFYANIHEHKPVDAKYLKNENLAYSQQELNRSIEKIKQDAVILANEYRRLKQTILKEYNAISPKETYAKALSALMDTGITDFPEMRHEASLCPIALLRQWRIDINVQNGNVSHNLKGIATAYGRGLSLAQARASCIMEIVERASAYVSVGEGGKWGYGKVQARTQGGDLLKASYTDLQNNGIEAMIPISVNKNIDNIPIHWIAGKNCNGQTIFVPAQAVFLFCNLDEPSFFEGIGSTGLGAGNSIAEAKLSALTELLERDAHATSPFNPQDCFMLISRDQRLQSLLDDYQARGIIPQFQDIRVETGIPAYRCFVTDKNGKVFQATGANLSGAKAAIAALTETPWPYVWATPAPYGKASGPGLNNLPFRFIEDLPDYSLPSPEANLLLLENTLKKQGRTPVYIDISRKDLGFPVIRAFAPFMDMDAELDEGPSLRLLARTIKSQKIFTR